MQFSNNSSQQGSSYLSGLPSILIVSLDGFTHNLTALESEIEQAIDADPIVMQLIDSLKQESRAQTEIDYYCLSLMEENHYGTMFFGFEDVLEYIRELGNEIYRTLRMHRAYVHGYLPYKYCNVKSNGLYLKREDLFKQEVNRELRESSNRQFEPLDFGLVQELRMARKRSQPAPSPYPAYTQPCFERIYSELMPAARYP